MPGIRGPKPNSQSQTEPGPKNLESGSAKISIAGKSRTGPDPRKNSKSRTEHGSTKFWKFRTNSGSPWLPAPECTTQGRPWTTLPRRTPEAPFEWETKMI